jgi:hypothetical protein
MKPDHICHMIASVDGRTLLRRWRPVDESRGKLFERLNEEFGSDAWLVGRVTGQEYTAPFERALSRSRDDPICLSQFAGRPDAVLARARWCCSGCPARRQSTT